MSYQGFTTSGIRAALHALFPDGGSPLYIGLLTAFGDAQDGSDVVQAGIARVACDAWDDSSIPISEEETVLCSANGEAITFESLLSDMTFVGVAVFSAASGGNPIAVGLLLEDGAPIASKDFTAGQSPTFGIGTLVLGINKMQVAP